MIVVAVPTFGVPLINPLYDRNCPTGAASANSFDIAKLDDFKLYRLRQAYNNAFGDLYQRGGSRYIQFGLKLFF